MTYFETQSTSRYLDSALKKTEDIWDQAKKQNYPIILLIVMGIRVGTAHFYMDLNVLQSTTRTEFRIDLNRNTHGYLTESAEVIWIYSRF